MCPTVLFKKNTSAHPCGSNFGSYITLQYVVTTADDIKSHILKLIIFFKLAPSVVKKKQLNLTRLLAKVWKMINFTRMITVIARLK